MRSFEKVVARFGSPIFTIEPDQDKSMYDESIHEIVDIPLKVFVFLRPENKHNDKMFHKYITFSMYKEDGYMYHQDANEMLVRYFLDKHLNNGGVE